MSDTTYDVVIVGAGISGSIVARELAERGKRVLILESGALAQGSRDAYLENFYRNSTKTPESAYPPLVPSPATQAAPRATTADTFSSNIPDGYPQNLTQPDGYIFDPAKSYLLQKGPHAFASTYERLPGGTTWHWLGTSLRFLEHDFSLETTYGVGKDWPLSDQDLLSAYNRAESEIGVSADAATQEQDLGSIGLIYAPPDYQYPMQAIPMSLVDQAVAAAVANTTFDDQSVIVTSTPAGRNSQMLGADSRRACQGNTNCIPICPIQAKYDATVTLSAAQQTGNVTLIQRAVATRVAIGENGTVSGIEYTTWTEENGVVAETGSGTAVGTIYVLAAHAIETPRLLLMSATDQSGLATGVANSSDQVGRNLMDHPLYLSWSLMPYGQPVWGYRGPLATSGIESLRDGAFRSKRSAWRVEIGNEGWNFSIGDPWTTTIDLIDGSNTSQLNPGNTSWFGGGLTDQLNDLLTRQWRMGFLVEQLPDSENRVTLATASEGGTLYTDGLGLPRPVIHYRLDEYCQAGFVAADLFTREVYHRLGAQNYTQNPALVPNASRTSVLNPTWFPLDPKWRAQFEQLPAELKDPKVTGLPAAANGVPPGYQYFGSGHIVGTVGMGSAASSSVLDSDLCSWDHPNLFMVGSGTFPTIATANPTLTIAALAFRAADAILKRL